MYANSASQRKTREQCSHTIHYAPTSRTTLVTHDIGHTWLGRMQGPIERRNTKSLGTISKTTETCGSWGLIEVGTRRFSDRFRCFLRRIELILQLVLST